MIASLFRFAVIVMISAEAPVPAVSAEDSLGEAESSVSARNILDGKRFLGEIGELGEPADTEDLLIFEDGMFISRECERRCGYPPAPYWVRFGEEGVQVRVKATCEDADATMIWTGTVQEDEIEGTIKWTSERWYWTIEKEMWFRGKLVTAENALRPDVQ